MNGPNLKQFKKQELKDPHVRAEYERLTPAFALRRQMIAARLHSGLTQEQVAEAMKTRKSNISRLENVESRISPTLATIEKYARATGHTLEIRLIPSSLRDPGSGPE